jgi:zinc protease
MKNKSCSGMLLSIFSALFWPSIAELGAAAEPSASDDFAELRGKIVSFRLDNGLRIVLCPRNETPTVTCLTSVKMGSADEEPGERGFARLWSRMAFHGTPHVGSVNWEVEKEAWVNIAAARQRMAAIRAALPESLRESLEDFELRVVGEDSWPLTNELLRETMRRAVARQGAAAGSEEERRIQLFFFQLSRVAAGALPQRGEHLVDLDSRRKFIEGLKEEYAPLLKGLRPEITAVCVGLIEQVGQSRESFGEFLVRKTATDLCLAAGIDETRAAEFAAAAAAARRTVDAAAPLASTKRMTEIQRSVGAVNPDAFSDADRFIVHVSLPAHALETWAALEADRLLNSVPRGLEKSVTALLAVRRQRIAEDSFGRLYAVFMNAAFGSTSYGASEFGTRTDLVGCTPAKAATFFQRNCTAERIALVLVGALDVESARKLLTDHFGRLPRGAARPLAAPPSVRPESRRAILEDDAPPMIFLGRLIPERNHADAPALELTAALLGGGEHSRLREQFVRAGRAVSASAWVGPGDRQTRLFCLALEPAPGVALDELEATAIQTALSVNEEAPAAAELRGVKARRRMDFLMRLRTNLGLAQALADGVLLWDDPLKIFDEQAAWERLTPDDVRRAVSTYLAGDAWIVARLNFKAGKRPREILGATVAPAASNH